jgi:poly(A) polymerase
MLPEIHVCKGVAQPSDYHNEGDVWDHLLMITRAFTGEHGSDIRLAAVFHDCGKAQTFSLDERIRFQEHASVSGDLAREALTRLQCPKKRVQKIEWLVRHHMMMQSFSSMSTERKAHWYYHPWFTELLQLFWLDIAGTEPSDFSLYENILRDYHAYLDAHPVPPKTMLTGEDVMSILGIGEGERIGEILRLLYGRQLTGDVTSKDEARAFIKSLIDCHTERID